MHPMEMARTPLYTLFNKAAKQLALAIPTPWNFRDSAKLAQTLLSALKNKKGELVQPTSELQGKLERVFDVKYLQQKALEDVIEEIDTDVPEEIEEYLERIMDPSMFQRELLMAGWKKPIKRKKNRLDDLEDQVE